MLTLQQIKENPDQVVERLAIKGFDGRGPIDEIMKLDAQRRQLQLSNDTRAAELNKLAASIGALMKQGKKDEAEEAKRQVSDLKAQQKDVADSLADTERRMRDILLTVPNLPCPAVPKGLTAEDNVVEKTGGPMPDLPADALPHWDLAKKYDLILVPSDTFGVKGYVRLAYCIDTEKVERSLEAFRRFVRAEY